MEVDFSSPTAVKEALTELAFNMRWSWNHAADALWSQLDPDLWELTRNPCAMLQTVSAERLKKVAASKKFQQALEELYRRKAGREQTQSWFERTHSRSPLKTIAYFSMEYMLNDALPIYSGGLGNVAGDQLKAASDLGVPVIGIGLLYQVGYFRQRIDADGRQQALYPFNNPGQLPIRPVRKPNGEWLRIRLQLPGFQMFLRTWQAEVGRAKLYLLDTNDPANLPEYRGIASELYGGGPDLRIQQELVLGIGGWRLLRELKIRPEICHLNEGHAAFATLERARDYMETRKVPFATALTVTRAGNLFTTHTAVAAGFDLFDPNLVENHFRSYVQDTLRISMKEFLALGRKNPDDPHEPFNMALLAIRGSGAVNGVSILHGKVSRRLFQDIFPRWPENDVPIGSVTNGVHVPIWDSKEADDLWTEVCGRQRWNCEHSKIGENIALIPDARLWQMRSASRRSLVELLRKRLARQAAGQGALADELKQLETLFDPDVLTLGFARRFATYKRPNLLLKDKERLLSILNNKDRPVQLVIAGKAHPQDSAGQEMIRQWIQFIRHTEARSKVMFLSDYDMRLTEYLVNGVDVWLNTPRRPWEACGTSGMKVLVNGGLNLSVLDGWWAEAYQPEVGWALGDGQEHSDNQAQDDADAEQLYQVLEQQVIPEFYDRSQDGMPTAWIRRVRASMAQLTPVFSATRCVQEYTTKYYVPLATNYLRRSKSGANVATDLLRWRQQLADAWPKIHFLSLNVETTAEEHHFQVHVYLGDLSPNAVQVQLYAEPADGGEPLRIPMVLEASSQDSTSPHYTASVPALRPSSDFTPRLIPYHPEATIPLEAESILWYR
ncbi:MAG: alpha-glucan family phosphorylase [Acidobacteriaceae bacterium]